jgi:hypothetical protein
VVDVGYGDFGLELERLVLPSPMELLGKKID